MLVKRLIGRLEMILGYRLKRDGLQKKKLSHQYCVAEVHNSEPFDPQNNTKRVNWSHKTVRSIEIFGLKRLFGTRNVLDTTSNVYLGVY